MSELMEQALREDVAYVALMVRHATAVVRKRDHNAADELSEKCVGIIRAVFQPGVHWDECEAALDTIYGLCIIAIAGAGPVQ